MPGEIVEGWCYLRAAHGETLWSQLVAPRASIDALTETTHRRGDGRKRLTPESHGPCSDKENKNAKIIMNQES